jgi:hypothetical protein
MLALLLTLFLAFTPARAGQGALDARKKEFIDLLKTLPTKGEFYTEEAVRRASPYLPSLFSLTEKDIEGYDFYPFIAISRGLGDHKEHRSYAVAHFAEIRHPGLKLFWAAMLFDSGDISPEIVRYLRDALDEPEQADLLAQLVGPGFKSFRRKVGAHPYTNEGGKKVAQQSEEDEGHADWVVAVAFSPDGKMLVSGSHDGTLILWDVATGKQLRSIEGHRLHGRPFEVVSVAFSSDGKMLSSASSDQTVRLWSAGTGAQLRVFTGVKFAQEVVFSSDGSKIAAANCETVMVWDTATGALSRTFRKAPTDSGRSYCAAHVAFSPDGRNLIADGGPIEIWEVSTGVEVRRFKPQGSGPGMALSPDGKGLLLGEDFEGSHGMIELWDVGSGKLARRFPQQPNPVECVALAPDGKIAASESRDGFDIESDGIIKLWDVATGVELRKLVGHKRRVAALAFAPDGKTLASGSWDHSVKLWNVATGKEIRSLPANY